MLFMLFTVTAYADVTSKIIAQDLDTQRKRLRFFVEYKVDGVVWETNYPSDLPTINQKGYPASLEGREYMVAKLSPDELIGLTNSQRLAVLDAKIAAFSKEVIRNIFRNLEIKEISDNGIPDLTNRSSSEKSAIILLDTDGDGISDKQAEVKTDGSKTITDLP